MVFDLLFYLYSLQFHSYRIIIVSHISFYLIDFYVVFWQMRSIVINQHTYRGVCNKRRA